MESVLLSLWNYVRIQYKKIFGKKPHIFNCNMTFTKRNLDFWLMYFNVF